MPELSIQIVQQLIGHKDIVLSVHGLYFILVGSCYSSSGEGHSMEVITAHPIVQLLQSTDKIRYYEYTSICREVQ